VGISGIRVHTMLEKDPNNTQSSIFRRNMQRCPIPGIQGVSICTVLKENLSNLFYSRIM
jgi:hypothetical protein